MTGADAASSTRLAATRLAARLRSRIAVEGPLTVAAFMAEVLLHPEHGYYMRQDPFGAGGDFVTAPEISQTFGELIGLWCADTWQAAGSPAPVRLIELGPGRGTLMADAWRATAAAPGFRAAARIDLVEVSPALRAIQRRSLAGLHEIARPEIAWPEIAWHDGLAAIPDRPGLIVANELFDALPIHQFVRTGAGWRERLIAAGDGDDGFRFVLDSRLSPRATLIPERVREAPLDAVPLGSVAETAPAAISLVTEIARRVASSGIAALIVDYGPARSGTGDTFQAVRRHGKQDPLADPGSADLTAHVDFETLARAAQEAGTRPWGPVPQGTFLQRLGIRQRTEMLLRRAAPAQAAGIVAGVRRLIAPDEMGTLFQVLALTAPDSPPPAGFDSPARPAP